MSKDKNKIIVVETENEEVFGTVVNVSSNVRVNGGYSTCLLEEDSLKSIEGEVVCSVTVQGEVSGEEVQKVMDSYEEGLLGNIGA